MAVPVLRWGIVGTGWIADMFIADLLTPREGGTAKHIITAIGSSTSVAKAQSFVDKNWRDSKVPHPKLYGSYQEVYNAPEVDIVYIATPHSLHAQNCLDSIKSGKHVLCEKPFTINAAEAEEVVAAAKAKGVFLMEGVWTRFFPLVIDLQKQIQAGVIGGVRRSVVEIGLSLKWDELPKTSRLKDPALGGGALLDLCLYPLTYSSMIMGAGRLGDEYPEAKVTSTLDLKDGVDESDTVIMQYRSSDGLQQTAISLATVHFSNSPDFGYIYGTNGSIVLYTEKGPSCPTGFRVTKGKEEVQDFRFDQAEGTMGFIHEADAVARDIVAGRTENAIMPLKESLRVMRLLDQIRAQNGLIYPQDKA